MSKLIGKIEQEISDYLYGTVEISEGVNYSQSKLVRRIYLFKNKVYPRGKIDKQSRYKFWYDIISPRVSNEVKNFRIDTKNPLVFSLSPVKDFAATLITNIAMKDYMWTSGKAEEMNESTENFSADGNILFKKVKNGYESTDPDNTYIVNQTAKTVNDTAIIERHQMTQSEIREKTGVWNNIDEVIKSCGERQFAANLRTTDKSTTNPYYEIFERNGEVSEAELFEAQGKGEEGDPNKYILAKIVVAGLDKAEKDDKYYLFAEALGNKKMSDIYEEAHRGPYKGKWWREGMYEILFDYQIRANQIGNDLAKGLEWAGKVIFKSTDNQTVQNILTDIANGDVIKSEDLSQVDVRMRGLDQLIADWNRLLSDVNVVANSFEVVTGEEAKGNMPFRLGLLLDTNANKLFVFLRQKLGLAYNNIYKRWILPDLVSKLRGKEIIQVTGNPLFLDMFRKMAVDNWYLKNLVAIGPHTPDEATLLKEAKLVEFRKTDPFIKNSKEIWDDVLRRLWVTITGENIDFDDEFQTITTLLQFETDPIRRSFLLDRVYAIKGLPAPPPVQAVIPQVGPPAGEKKEKTDTEKQQVKEFSAVKSGTEEE